jgi:hypothetical protein
MVAEYTNIWLMTTAAVCEANAIAAAAAASAAAVVINI